MKWIKKLFGKKEDSSEETGFREIDFEDLPAWLDARYQKISSGMEKDISRLLRELEVALLELKESNARLSEAKVEGDFDVRAVKRAKSNRENVTKQVATLIDKIKVQEDTDFRALKEFYDAAAQNLETCLENMDRSFKYARGVFPQESKELNESLSRLSRVFKEFRETILGNKGEIEAIEAAYSDIREIQKLSTSIASEKLELESKNKKIEVSKAEIARASQALKEFIDGDVWQNSQNLQGEFTAAGNRLKKAEESLSSLVLPLSGYLSRILKLNESGRYKLKPEVKQQLHICLEDPTRIDPSVFPELQKMFEDNALDMQIQKKEKALVQVKALISGFPERKKEYLEVLQNFEEKKAQISKLDTGRLGELEHKERELLSRAHLLEEDIENSKKKLAALRGELQNRKEKILININLIDSGMKLNFKA
ncbi:MAG: cell surface protein [Alphaproteobacteria bacterium]|nr:MAG: cell surface protein [Alphaproteobacteria bacterium]